MEKKTEKRQQRTMQDFKMEEGEIIRYEDDETEEGKAKIKIISNNN